VTLPLCCTDEERLKDQQSISICFYFSKLQQIHTTMTLKKYTIYDKRAKYNNTVKYSQKVTSAGVRGRG
jgi:hypothetical protein